ncbi:MAG: glycoside-pentoside-hexuronide (GPH):cation symporter [Planctomycetes bacterium]|nr:glycoside-pentoside-hexuronide (GPH):cation symporter [Planctomycetota bacterium]
MGVSVCLVGTILLLSRVFDGVSDMLFGFVLDKTRSKHGKARSWVLWMTLPFGLSAVALFLLPPGMSTVAQGIYIFVTYNLVNTVVYTALNISYNTLLALMTRDQNERSKISMLRMGISPIMNMIVTALTLPFVRMLGGTQQAWVMVTSVYAVVAMIMLYCTFRFTRERVNITEVVKEDTSIPLIVRVKALFRNEYWAIVMLTWASLAVYQTIIGVDLPYYCQYILGNAEYMGVISISEKLPMIIIILFILPFVVPKFGNRNTALAGALLVALGHALILVNPENLNLAIASAIIKSIGSAPIYGVIFSMLADTIEFGQWKTHIRMEGLTNSAASFGSKAGAGFASAAVGFYLQSAGYNGMLAEQSTVATGAISKLFLFAPIAVWLFIALLLWFYKLDKKYATIVEELKQREAEGHF